MMNIFGSYYDNNWVITVIPRKRHRPWQYEAEGNDHLLSSPGAADIGGLFHHPFRKGFQEDQPGASARCLPTSMPQRPGRRGNFRTFVI